MKRKMNKVNGTEFPIETPSIIFDIGSSSSEKGSGRTLFRFYLKRRFYKLLRIQWYKKYRYMKSSAQISNVKLQNFLFETWEK